MKKITAPVISPEKPVDLSIRYYEDPSIRKIMLEMAFDKISAPAYCIIEQSDDGRQFLAMELVRITKEVLVGARLTYADNAPQKKVKYYRVEMNTHTGAVCHSPIIKANRHRKPEHSTGLINKL